VIPNWGVSNDLCSPSCPADEGNGGGGNDGRGKNKVIDSEAGSDTNANDSGKNPALIYGPIVGVFGFAAIAGIIYAVSKKRRPCWSEDMSSQRQVSTLHSNPRVSEMICH
jgi:hypothetical protein